MKHLFVGNKIYHIGYNEHENKVYEVKIIGFKGFAVNVQNSIGDQYFINTWEICLPNGNMLPK